MRIEEIREMTDLELEDAFEDQQAEMYRIRQLYYTGELLDTSSFKKVRKTIARILTVQRERELAAELVEEESES